MIILTKGLGHEKLELLLIETLTKVTFLTMQQTKHLVRKAKGPSKLLRFNQIDHIQWPL
jgi:hypothetical protein